MYRSRKMLSEGRYYHEASGIPCVADDSGIVVDALDGAPGVYSARYAGENAADADNNAKLLRELATVPECRRTARFVCCAAMVHSNGRTHSETGAVEGRIALEPRGQSGFGYDPVFIPEGYARTFAELGGEVKQRISHRARAFGKLRHYLEQLEERCEGFLQQPAALRPPSRPCVTDASLRTHRDGVRPWS